MAEISKVNDVAWADIAEVAGVEKASIAKMGGTDAPASGPTASANLAHWWKMNEGSTTSATDYGEAEESGTNFTMSGVTAVTGGGPTPIGSPDHVLTSDYNDIIYTKTIKTVQENLNELDLDNWDIIVVAW